MHSRATNISPLHGEEKIAAMVGGKKLQPRGEEKFQRRGEVKA
jgi:hypothetical protein